MNTVDFSFITLIVNYWMHFQMDLVITCFRTNNKFMSYNKLNFCVNDLRLHVFQRKYRCKGNLYKCEEHCFQLCVRCNALHSNNKIHKTDVQVLSACNSKSEERHRRQMHNNFKALKFHLAENISLQMALY